MPLNSLIRQDAILFSSFTHGHLHTTAGDISMAGFEGNISPARLQKYIIRAEIATYLSAHLTEINQADSLCQWPRIVHVIFIF